MGIRRVWAAAYVAVVNMFFCCDYTYYLTKNVSYLVSFVPWEVAVNFDCMARCFEMFLGGLVRGAEMGSTPTISFSELTSCAVLKCSFKSVHIPGRRSFKRQPFPFRQNSLNEIVSSSKVTNYASQTQTVSISFC